MGVFDAAKVLGGPIAIYARETKFVLAAPLRLK